MNDKIYKSLLFAAALVMPIICGGVVYALVTDAYGAFEHFGFLNFLTSTEWDYTTGAEKYGALPFITGTLMTTALALLFCIPFSFYTYTFGYAMLTGSGNFFKKLMNTMTFSIVAGVIFGLSGLVLPNAVNTVLSAASIFVLKALSFS